MLGPQLVLSAGVLGSLLTGTIFPDPQANVRRFLKGLVVAAIAAALMLAASGVPSEFGPLIRVDGISLSWQVLLYAAALPLALILGVCDEVPAALLLASVLGMGLLAVSWNLFMLFIGLEFMSLPAYLLVSRSRGSNSAALEASVKYFFAGSLAGALYLMGMALYYASAKSLALASATGRLADASLVLMGAAALFKLGAVPFHFWLADVYEGSDPELAGFLSTAMKSAAVLFLMRLAALAPHSTLARALPWAAALTMLAGALLALRQENLQRLLAYSSIAHAGNVLLGVGCWAAQGALHSQALAVFFYLAAYAFMSNGAFLWLKASGISTRRELIGYARRDPLSAGAFAALLLALAGVPPGAGFLAKLLIFWEALKTGLYIPLVCAGLSALIAMGYYLSLVRDMYFEEESGTGSSSPSSPGGTLARTLALACALPSAVLGLMPWILDFLARGLAR